ncbi:histidine kinase [Paenibacillus darwinianus]|uniref:Signal transduction histidine-protein kinase ArlS n=1 Tax=Paenibacillus darwinianus TaxID=1380763 RepID=A0A9W5W6R5_9BACL|nr:HAMP domain-containing histidine kinase [Paenibacillus darwinianus]EXX85663.1 histidine kinase [Paenibacillus darwinianus]EXX89891.1 histidine kinase [Paenibacillus darwinianus]EXX90728.1 histidine kinase [Paenibacillus darwinianus]
MTLRKRFTLFTIFWLIFILILFNIFVYFFVIKISTNSEEQLLRNKVTLLLENVNIDSSVRMADPKLLSEFYNVNEAIRIVDVAGRIVNAQGSDQDLLKRPVSFSRTHASGMTKIGSLRVLYMKVPLYSGMEVIGMLEITRKLTLLDTYLQVLVAALSVTSLGAVFFAIFGTYWFTSKLTAPIQTMVQTMREIDRSGKLRKIELKGREESAELLQLIRAFNQMIERLDRTFASQKAFVADASHELKTPLTVISSYANMLKRWGRNDSTVRDEAIEAISKESERLQKLIKSMLTLAEAEQEDWLKLETFDVMQLSDELASMLHTTFHRTIRVHADSDGNGIRMTADKDKIRQLMVILIDNAIKYSKDPIDIVISQTRNMVRILVKDNGIGIPEHEIPNLFERFFRVDGARSRTTGGVGLGLSIAKRIVDLHEGHIDVFSKPEKGTTIALQFPKKTC